MNTKKTIYEKLFSENKVELESHKIDLANIKDLDKKYTQIINEQKKLDKINPALEKLMSDKKSSVNMLSIYIKESNSVLAEFEKQTKELGLSPDGVSQYKNLKIETQNSQEYVKK